MSIVRGVDSFLFNEARTQVTPGRVGIRRLLGNHPLRVSDLGLSRSRLLTLRSYDTYVDRDGRTTRTGI